MNFSFSVQGAVPKDSIPVKFTYICRFEQVGINARKFEKTRIRFNRDTEIGELSVPLKKSWLRLLFLLLILSLIIQYSCDEFFPQITPLLEFKSGPNLKVFEHNSVSV